MRDLEDMMLEFRNKDNYLQNLIEPFYNIIDNSILSLDKKYQKKEELFFVLSFLYYCNQSIKIIDILSDKPDFIIGFNNVKIGLEITELVIDSDKKDQEGHLRSLFYKIEQELSHENLEKYQGLYGIEFIDSNFKITQKQKLEIKDEIKNIIQGLSVNKKHIANIRKTENLGVVRLYKPFAAFLPYLPSELIIEQIKKKENKIFQYNPTIEENWLLIFSQNTIESSDYSSIINTQIFSGLNSSFNKIFHFNSFKGNIFEIK